MVIVAVFIVGASAIAMVTLLVVARHEIARDLVVRSNARKMRGVPVKHSAIVASDRLPSLVDATASLTEYARKIRPEWIFGVNYGGHMLASYVAEQIKLPKQFVGTIQAIGGDSPQLIPSDQQNYIGGSVLIIDDIARTGGTLERIRQFLLRANAVSDFSFSDIRMATLFVADSVGESSLRLSPHWFFAKVEGNAHTFPWTQDSADLKGAWSKTDPNSQAILSNWRLLLSDQAESRARAVRFFEMTGH